MTLDEIQQAVAARFRLQPHDLVGARRTPGVAHPRMIAMYLGRLLARASYRKVAEHFGDKDVSTVMHACRRVVTFHEAHMQRAVTELLAQLGANPEIDRAGWREKRRPPKRRRQRAEERTAPAVPETTCAAVVEAVCAHFNVAPATLAVRSPSRRTIYIRSVAVFLCRELALAPYADILTALGVVLLESNLTTAAARIRWDTTAAVKADLAGVRARLTGPAPAATPAAG